MEYVKKEHAFAETAWQWFHEHPELSINTVETAAYIADNLHSFGYDNVTIVSGGVVAKWDTGIPGPVFCLRSDIDALQFCIEGKIINDHACGHDAHATILLTAAKILKEQNLVKRGKLVLLFQPGEEDNIGALAMINSGLLDDVEEIVSAHIDTMKIGTAMPSCLNHGCAVLTADITGKNAHASAPECGINATEIACSAVNAMKTMVVSLDPGVCHSCKATYFNAAGSSTNTIPDRAIVCWDMRSETNEMLEELHIRGEKVIRSVVESLGAAVQFSYEYTPAANPGPQTVALTTKVITKILGSCAPVVITPAASGDDFHFYGVKLGIPSAYIGLGASCSPMHVYGLTFNHKALEYGIDIYVECVYERLG